MARYWTPMMPLSKFDCGIDSHAMPTRKNKLTMRGLLVSICLLALVMFGCGASRLRVDYKGYESSYAESANRQLLINLARLNQHHPTYFFKLGPISTTYRIQGTVTGSGSQIAGLYTNPLNQNVTGGGTVGTLLEQDPTFNFIPVNDDTVAKQLLTPIPDQYFYIYFQEGWPVDMLFRSMVDRIEYHKPGSKDVQVIRNTDTADNIPGYLTFLRISALCYELQKKGYLLLDSDNSFVPIASNWEQTNPPTLADLMNAQAKNLVFKKNEKGNWELGQTVIEPKLTLSLPPGGLQQVEDDVTSNGEMPELKGVDSLGPTLQVLASGIKISSTVSPGGGARIVLRSLIGVMAAAAQEQNTFDEVMKNLPAGQKPLPPLERRPLLRLTWSSEARLTPSLVELEYMGQNYRVADELSDSPLKESSWNRDVFRLVAELSSQVTVDISKFPLPTVLQIRPQ
jgi:hypothetical protein